MEPIKLETINVSDSSKAATLGPGIELLMNDKKKVDQIAQQLKLN